MIVNTHKVVVSEDLNENIENIEIDVREFVDDRIVGSRNDT